MVFIYVLKQQNNKYYVGKTSSPKFRLDTHFKTGGCAWTKKYKPTQIIGLFPDCDTFDEDKYTIKYMKKYGIENVRGGSFCQVSLDRETKKCVERMICSANDGCHFCGEQGHFIRNCPKNKFKKRNKEFKPRCNVVFYSIHLTFFIYLDSSKRRYGSLGFSI